MKRRFYVSVLDNNERKVILTGDMLPIEIVVEKTDTFRLTYSQTKKLKKIIFSTRRGKMKSI